MSNRIFKNKQRLRIERRKNSHIDNVKCLKERAACLEILFPKTLLIPQMLVLDCLDLSRTVRCCRWTVRDTAAFFIAGRHVAAWPLHAKEAITFFGV